VKRRVLRFILRGLVCLLLAIALVWAFGALFYDFPVLHGALAWIFALGALAVLVFVPGFWKKTGALLLAWLLVLSFWLALRPRDDRTWQPDVAQRASAEIKGDEVTLHNVRNCEYRTETDYTPHWETRTVRLSQLTGVDIAITYWGSPWIAHPTISFEFADTRPLCFSIEARKEIGESYSAIGGFYRQYELIYVVAEETDVLRLRTNFRKGEDVYLYRVRMTPAQARERFLEYLDSLNALQSHPRWYNAATTNCTTSIRDQHAASKRLPWDWRLLANGKSDELLFARGMLVTGGLPFAELKRRSLINERARAVAGTADFSAAIRAGVPGFEEHETAR
jgi:membrane protein implicated in regulation of membrane protease activity